MERTKQLRSRTLDFLMFQAVYYASFNISPIADKPFIFLIVSCICVVNYFSSYRSETVRILIEHIFLFHLSTHSNQTVHSRCTHLTP